MDSLYQGIDGTWAQNIRVDSLYKGIYRTWAQNILGDSLYQGIDRTWAQNILVDSLYQGIDRTWAQTILVESLYQGIKSFDLCSPGLPQFDWKFAMSRSWGIKNRVLANTARMRVRNSCQNNYIY